MPEHHINNNNIIIIDQRRGHRKTNTNNNNTQKKNTGVRSRRRSWEHTWVNMDSPWLGHVQPMQNF